VTVKRIVGGDMLAGGAAHPLAQSGVIDQLAQRGDPLLLAAGEQAGLAIAHNLAIDPDRAAHARDADRAVLDGLEAAFSPRPVGIRHRIDADIQRLEIADLPFGLPGQIDALGGIEADRPPRAHDQEPEAVAPRQLLEGRDDGLQVGAVEWLPIQPIVGILDSAIVDRGVTRSQLTVVGITCTLLA
jgi:hypothetical protein